MNNEQLTELLVGYSWLESVLAHPGIILLWASFGLLRMDEIRSHQFETMVETIAFVEISKGESTETSVSKRRREMGFATIHIAVQGCYVQRLHSCHSMHAGTCWEHK